jgi:hypothetical protein
LIVSADGTARIVDHERELLRTTRGFSRDAGEPDLYGGGQRGLPYIYLVGPRWAFTKLPNELIEHQRQAIDRRDQLINFAWCEFRQFRGAECVADLDWCQSPKRQSAKGPGSAQAFKLGGEKRFGASRQQ